MIDLPTSPVWSSPNVPQVELFERTFEGFESSADAEVLVYHKWGWWMTELLFKWLLAFLVIVPVAFIFFRSNVWMGVIARIGVGLIGGALSCLLFWVLIGGWGAPAPLFFGTVGILVGCVWAFAYRKASI